LSLNRYMGVAMAVTLFGLTACSNSLEPTLIPIPDEPGEATLVDVSAGAVADPSAFDVITGGSVRTDQFSGWDFLFQVQEDGSTVLWPRGAITGEDLDAGLQKVLQTFDALREAPENGYTNLDSLQVAMGDVFAVQSRRDPAFGNLRCRRFAKVEIQAIDPMEGTISFIHLVNPNCEKRKLVPGAED